MSLIKTAKYWQATRKAYSALGGKFSVKEDKPGVVAHVPADKDRWIIARELAFTDNRVCVKCGSTMKVDFGDAIKHCGMLMAADLNQAQRTELAADIGRLKISFKQKAKSPNPGPYSDSEWDKIEQEDAEGEKREQEQKQRRLDKMKQRRDPEGIETKSDQSAPSEKSEEKKEAQALTAHFVRDEENIGDSHWIVKKAGNPVLKLTLAQAFPGHEATKAPIFAQPSYGATLLNGVTAHGVEAEAKKIGAKVFGQFNQSAPNTLMPKPENVEDTDQQGKPPTGQQANPGMVTQEVGDEILDDKNDRQDIIELVKAALVPFIAAAGDEISVQSVVAEIKALAQSEQALNDFQGSLDEMVHQFQDDHNVAEEEKDEAESKPQEQNSADAGGMTPPPDQQPREALKKVSDSEAALKKQQADHEQVRQKLVAELKESQQREIEAERRYQHELANNKMLMIERTMSKRHPRCAQLAKKLVEIGEVSEQDYDKHVVALLKMPTSEFLETEIRVGKVHDKLIGNTAPKFQTKGLISVIDDHRDEGKKEATLKSGPRQDANGGGSKLSSAIDWSKPSSVPA